MGQKSSKQPQVDARYLAPQTLCCFNEVDLRKLRRLIKDRKLAPCFPGIDSESREVIVSPALPASYFRPFAAPYLFVELSSAVGRVPDMLPQVPKPQPGSMLP